MTVAFDTTFLSFLFNPETKPRTNPATKAEVTHCNLRIEALVDDCSKRGEAIIIPAPCLSELLTGVPEFEKAVTEIEKSGAMEIASFDARCAVDLAEFNRKQIASGVKKSDFLEPYQRIKLDRQKDYRASVVIKADWDTGYKLPVPLKSGNFARTIFLEGKNECHAYL